MQSYSDPSRENDPHALPDVEVFHVPTDYQPENEDGGTLPDGWYWWPCFPGCIPDGDPSGPFDTEDEALADARDNADLAADAADENGDSCG